MYLAEYHDAGKALFTKLQDAKEWLEYQHSYHRLRFDEEEHQQDVREAAEVKWVDGGHHRWHSLRSVTNPVRSFARIEAMVLDEHAPRDDWPVWD